MHRVNPCFLSLLTSFNGISPGPFLVLTNNSIQVNWREDACSN